MTDTQPQEIPIEEEIQEESQQPSEENVKEEEILDYSVEPDPEPKIDYESKYKELLATNELNEKKNILDKKLSVLRVPKENRSIISKLIDINGNVDENITSIQKEHPVLFKVQTVNSTVNIAEKQKEKQSTTKIKLRNGPGIVEDDIKSLNK